tara:strand:- start:323 stop:532 length:210 start_codon:yes stop_codon:yes gene_type:complete
MKKDLKKDETKRLQKAHINMVSAAHDYQQAKLELDKIRNEVLLAHESFGASFNSTYAEIVSSNGDLNGN